jgi:SSS family solute:Na+ symporter
VVVDALSRSHVLNLSNQGASFLGAIAAFVVDVLLSIIISVVTRPKPDSELVGLVWSLTPRDKLRQAGVGEDAGWYRKPAVLGTGVLICAVALSIVFW